MIESLKMEEMIFKFPHIGRQIFEKLTDENLAKCLKVSQSWEHPLAEEKFQRIERIQRLRVKYETIQKNKDKYGYTTLHQVAENGQFMGNLFEKGKKVLIFFSSVKSACQLVRAVLH